MAMQMTEYTVDNLDIQLDLTRKIVVKSGEVLKRGALVELNGGKAIKFAGGNPYAIVLEDVDASTADTTGVVSWKGIFNAAFVDFGTGTDDIATRDALAVNGSYLID